MIIDFTEYLERRRRTAETRVMQVAAITRRGGRVARQGAVGIQAGRGALGTVRWSSFLPLLPALELAALYAEASLI